MAMTVGEANAVNRVLDWLLLRDNEPLERPSLDVVRDAAQILAAGASRRLGAGWSPRAVERAPFRPMSGEETT